MSNNEVYKDYLKNLKNRIYKILPLCEEKNPSVLKHIRSTVFEVEGLFSVIPTAKTSVWNIRTLAVLGNMERNYSIAQLHDESVYKKDIRREVLNLLNLLDREIDNL